MRNFSISHVALALLLVFVPSPVGGQQAGVRPDDGGAVRGAFRNTRSGVNRAAKKDAENKPEAAKPAKSGKASHGSARPKDSPAKAGRPNEGPAELKGAAPAGTGPLLAPAPEGERPGGIALGYTLFLRAPTGEARRVSNTREFKSGDSVRLLVETNTDGYLYIFNAENDAGPLMIFPNAKIQRGANFVRAHVPYEIPSSTEADENLRWLSFDDRPANERVYFIVSKKPLEGVPAGEALLKWCAGTESEACAWAPKPEQWEAIKGGANRVQLVTSREPDDGRPETAAEREAATRGLGLPADAPLPSVIYMIASASAHILVASVDLIHR